MANRSTPSDKVLVDPLFKVPEGAEDQFTFSREGTDEEIGVSETDEGLEIEIYSYEEGETSLDYDDGYDDQTTGATLETPEVFAVISQTLRRAPGGQQVVDIVVETEDINGAVNYEFQVTKI